MVCLSNSAVIEYVLSHYHSNNVANIEIVTENFKHSVWAVLITGLKESTQLYISFARWCYLDESYEIGTFSRELSQTSMI